MRITERRLRSIIRSVIRESLDPDYLIPQARDTSYDPVNDAIAKVEEEINSCGASFRVLPEFENQDEYYADGDGVYRIPCVVDGVEGHVDINSSGIIVGHTFLANTKLNNLF